VLIVPSTTHTEVIFMLIPRQSLLSRRATMLLGLAGAFAVTLPAASGQAASAATPPHAATRVACSHHATAHTAARLGRSVKSTVKRCSGVPRSDASPQAAKDLRLNRADSNIAVYTPLGAYHWDNSGWYAQIYVWHDSPGYGQEYCERDWYYGSDATMRGSDGYITVDNTCWGIPIGVKVADSNVVPGA
jgi:hypothetical protein